MLSASQIARFLKLYLENQLMNSLDFWHCDSVLREKEANSVIVIALFIMIFFKFFCRLFQTIQPFLILKECLHWEWLCMAKWLQEATVTLVPKELYMGLQYVHHKLFRYIRQIQIFFKGIFGLIFFVANTWDCCWGYEYFRLLCFVLQRFYYAMSTNICNAQ